MNTYIKPTAKIIKIATQSLLDSASQLSVGGTTDQNLGKEGGFLWDEDEDDDPMVAPTFDVWEE